MNKLFIFGFFVALFALSTHAQATEEELQEFLNALGISTKLDGCTPPNVTHCSPGQVCHSENCTTTNTGSATNDSPKNLDIKLNEDRQLVSLFAKETQNEVEFA